MRIIIRYPVDLKQLAKLNEESLTRRAIHVNHLFVGAMIVSYFQTFVLVKVIYLSFVLESFPTCFVSKRNATKLQK